MLDVSLGKDHPHAATAIDDWYPVLEACWDRTHSTTQLQRQFHLAAGQWVSSQRVWNRLHQGNFYALRQIICILFTRNTSCGLKNLGCWNLRLCVMVIGVKYSWLACNTWHVLVQRKALKITPYLYRIDHGTDKVNWWYGVEWLFHIWSSYLFSLR